MEDTPDPIVEGVGDPTARFRCANMCCFGIEVPADVVVVIVVDIAAATAAGRLGEKDTISVES